MLLIQKGYTVLVTKKAFWETLKCLNCFDLAFECLVVTGNNKISTDLEFSPN